MKHVIPKKYINQPGNYDKFPVIQVNDQAADFWKGWTAIGDQLSNHIESQFPDQCIMIIETNHGIYHHQLIKNLKEYIPHSSFYLSSDCFLSKEQIESKVNPFLGDHPVFGYLSDLEMNDLFDPNKLKHYQSKIKAEKKGIIVVYGPGAYLLVDHYDILVYADMPRWEIQQRFRRNEISNLGIQNREAKTSKQYKRAYFVDWRICDRTKKSLMNAWDYVLDTTKVDLPKMITSAALSKGLAQAIKQPFRVVPFFDPGVWGGQWMKEVCNLDTQQINFAWCFDCVPEENSLLLKFNDDLFEIPSINLVFRHPENLLGQEIFNRFGAEFPIRFDFLDTMDGGNLSLQVHPTKQYIKDHFGMDYTQDESYYMLDTGDDAYVYLGLKDGIDPASMIADLKEAQTGSNLFEADKYVKKWSVKKHDHVLIPAGTIHCSGKNSMVLEISATPYIFTFKLWDWGRVDLDGLPRPISIEHGEKVINWEATESYTTNELINNITPIRSGDGWTEEQTGLHQSEFIETRRHWFKSKVLHDTKGTLNVINLVQGREAIIESPTAAFEPFVIHYAETVIIPAGIGEYTISPYGESIDQECATIKAYVRSEENN